MVQRACPAFVHPPGGITMAAANPVRRHEAARQAANARHSLDTYISSIVRRAGELTPEQVNRLRALLPPAGDALPDEAA
jgi:hypothetical protein